MLPAHRTQRARQARSPVVAEDGDAAAALTTLRLLMIHLKSFTAVAREIQPQNATADHALHLIAQGGLPSKVHGQRREEKLGLARIGVPHWSHFGSGSVRAHTSSHSNSSSADAALLEVEVGHVGGTKFSSAAGRKPRPLALAAAERSQPTGAKGDAGATAGPLHAAQAPWACFTNAMIIVRKLHPGLLGRLVKMRRLMAAFHWKSASKHSWSRISWTTRLLGS